MVDLKIKNGNDMFNFRVAAIIEKGNKYLFQKMPGDTNFTLVGGRVQFMENTKEAIRREILEEIGYDIINDSYEVKEIAENFFDYKDQEGIIHSVQTLLFIYKVVVKGDSKINQEDNFVMKDKENTTLHWLTKNEIQEHSILPSEAKRIIFENSFKYMIINDRQFKD